MPRTYLIVDGENHAIRAAKLHEELIADPSKAAALQARTSVRPEHFERAADHPGTLAPGPHKEAVIGGGVLSRGSGVLYAKGELYWDPLGLYVAFAGTFLSISLSIDRAYYFTSASGDRIDAHQRDLHAIGFDAHVAVRTKPDGWVKDHAAQGITVVSRPKPQDILIATQVLEDCMNDNFDRLIFVGGDEDYVPLLSAVRRRGKEIWLVAFERFLGKGLLRRTCDRFVPYDPVLAVRPLPTAPAAPDPSPS